jgi:stage V sporulation protein B
LPASEEKAESFGATAKQLLAIAIPITIGSAGLQILTMLETKIYMGQLLAMGNTQLEADTMKGIYNMSQTIYNMPCAFITPITISIIPAITNQLTLGDHKAARATEESAARVMGLICMPCAFGLATLAGPVTALLGGYTGADLALSTSLMSIMGFNIIFNAVVLLSNAMMQAHGHAVVPVVNMLVSGLMKLLVVYTLTGNPNIGILGAPIGTMLCFLCITTLNLLSMRRVISNPPALVKNLVRPFCAAAIMGVMVYGALYLLRMLGITSRLILCGIPIMVGVAVYVVAVVVLKAITREDCMLLPKGAKIAKILHL